MEGGRETASLRMLVAQHEARLREREQQHQAVQSRVAAAMGAFQSTIDVATQHLARFEHSAHHALLQQHMRGLEVLLHSSPVR